MNVNYSYYLLAKSDYSYPSWVKEEGYFNCEHFSRLFSFLRIK